MRILIVSDTHKHNENLEKILNDIGHIDMIIHCGDAEGSEDSIRYSVDCPMHIVAGNNDYFSDLDGEIMFDIENNKVFLTHGHYYYVNTGIVRLKEEALDRGVDIVMYGHTHRPMLVEEDGLIILNPGSLTYPRQPDRKGTYMIMETDAAGKIHYCLNYI